METELKNTIIKILEKITNKPEDSVRNEAYAKEAKLLLTTLENKVWLHNIKTQVKKISDLFEMVPHWPGIIEQDGQFRLTQKLLTKESLLDHKGILRLAFEFPPIMLPRKVIS